MTLILNINYFYSFVILIYFRYETENQKRNERIKVSNIEDNEEKDDRIVFHGRYSHVDADGIEYIVTYIADKKGYRPVVNVKRPNT